MKNALLILLFSLLFCTFAAAQSLPELEKVKEIKLLEHTRDDVRRILGEYELKTSGKDIYEDSFETKNTEIKVLYSEGRCNFYKKVSYDWNVREWKVTEIKVIPKNRLKINEIGLNLFEFKKENYYVKQKEPVYYHRKDIGLIFMVIRDKVWVISFEPPKKDYILMCDKKLAKRLLSTSNYFDPNDKNREMISTPNDPPEVLNLILSFDEIKASCPLDFESKTCSERTKIISVFTDAKDPENDALTYIYEISGGKLVGHGSKVLWDLSGIKAGTYTISAEVDDGGGTTEKKITKTVTVKECPDCKKP